MKFTLFFILFCCALSRLQAQTPGTLSGKIVDASGAPIISANIFLLKGTDSLRTVSNDKGEFNFNITAGQFAIRVISMGYEIWYRKLSYDNNVDRLPDITLYPKMNTLKEVVVEGKKTPVRFRQDTIEYAVSQYNLKDDAVIEDLLRRLPGLMVDKDGSISFMGQKITKLKINGQEYLVNDIKTLTRLLPANLADKIQLIDDYGEVARITGRKTGASQKVINIQTTQEIENINNAQLMLSAGNDNLYAISAIANHFSQKQQIFGSFTNNNLPLFEGTRTYTNADINFRQKISEKFSINAGLSNDRTSKNVLTNSAAETITSDGKLSSINDSKLYTSSNEYNARLDAEYRPSATDIVSLKTNGIFQSNSSDNESSMLQTGFQRKDQYASVTNKIDMEMFTGNLSAVHQFGKSRRTLSANITLESRKNNNVLDGRNILGYYDETNTSKIKDSSFQQVLNKDNTKSLLNSQFSYIEPLSEYAGVEIKYGSILTSSGYKLVTQFSDTSGNMNIIDSLSNKYSYNTTQHQIELNYRKNKGKLDYIFGVSWQPYFLKSMVNISGASLFPVFQLRYQQSKSTLLSINYLGSNIFPSYEQLQPVPDLSNPQFPIIGNPSLKPEVDHSLYFEVRNAGKSILFATLTPKLAINRIVNNVVLVSDSFNTVKQETRFLNTNGNYDVEFNYGWSRSFSNGVFNLSFDGTNAYRNAVLYLDNTKTYSKNLSLKQSLKSSLTLSKLEIRTDGSYAYNRNVYKPVSGVETNIHTLEFNLYTKIYFTSTFFLTANGNKQFNSGYSADINANPFFVSGELVKTFFKKKLYCRLEGFNLLNQVASVSQSIVGNTVTTTRSNRLGRYVLLTFILDLNNIK